MSVPGARGGGGGGVERRTAAQPRGGKRARLAVGKGKAPRSPGKAGKATPRKVGLLVGSCV